MRDEWGRMLASLIGQFRDIELAEDVLQDAAISALIHWPETGVPDRPVGWFIQTARRKAIDKIRRRDNYAHKRDQLALLAELENITDTGCDDMHIPDERLRLIFTCCHPALAESAQVALTLHTLCGLTALQVANAFLVTEATMRQRLVRAKRKIKAACIPYQVPPTRLLPSRLASVLSVIYLIFNEGYRSSSGEKLIEIELCDEALQMGNMLNLLLPDQYEVLGLLALMYFHHSRYPTRTDRAGDTVSLRRQDRSQWLQKYIARANQLLELATSHSRLGPYQIQAAISGVHSQARDYEQTDWWQIVLLYKKLHQYHTSPVVLLNAAVALSHAEGTAAGLRALRAIENEKALRDYQPFFAARADLLKRANRHAEAAADFRRAIELSQNEAERRYLYNQMENS